LTGVKHCLDLLNMKKKVPTLREGTLQIDRRVNETGWDSLALRAVTSE